jgi:uncharacterized protein YjdB
MTQDRIELLRDSSQSLCAALRSWPALAALSLLAIAGCGSSNTMTVTPKTVTAIAVTPGTASIAMTATEQFTATATYSDGSTANVTSAATWAVANSAIATVNASGMASPVATGSTTVTAALSKVSGSASLAVTASALTLSTIAVTPATASIAVNATQQYVATGTYSDGSTKTITSAVTWTSSGTATATITSAGLATGVAAGSSTITASLSGVSGSAALTVTATALTVSSIAVTPATSSITISASQQSVASGSTQQFTATATYSNGTTGNVTSSATWTSSNTSVAAINSSGLATGVGVGSSTITASLSGISQAATLTVTAPVISSIAVTPNPVSFASDATQQFAATATYNNGATANVSSTATWTSSNTAAATVDDVGLASGVAAGTTTIKAAVGTVSGTAAATVTVASTVAVSIPTWHVDNNRSGLNPKEFTLTPTNVNSSSFGKLFSYLVDGYVYGEPLIVANVTVNGAQHNVLYVATEYDSVYAFDADSGSETPLWKTSLLQAGELPLSNAPIQPWQGVTSTPVIDTSTNTIYVVSVQKTSGGNGTFRLSALDITTGEQKFGGPVTVNASVPGTNASGNGTTVTLTTGCVQRAALLEANSNIYIGIGGCPTGWLLAYNATILAQVGVFNASPNLNGEGTYASAGGIWMGSGGPVADSSGNVYVTTGNGPWDGQTAFSDSVLIFTPTQAAGPNGTMQPANYFTPSTYQYMDCADSDLAAGGLLLIPGSRTLVSAGKMGKIYLNNADKLGNENATDSGAEQELWFEPDLSAPYSASCTDSSGTHTTDVNAFEIYGTSAYFNGYLYLGISPTSSSAVAPIRQFKWDPSALTLTAGAYTSPNNTENTRGTTPFISANGSSNGIVWAILDGVPLQQGTPTAATLYAYDADNFPNMLYNSSQNSADAAGYSIKFTSPVVANGKVYISTGHDLTTVSNPQGEIDVYGPK